MKKHSNSFRLIWNAIADYKCNEFHITPVLTLSYLYIKELDKVKGGYMLALEWGFWAVYFGYVIYD